MRLKKLSFRLQSYCHFIVISVMINNIYFISRNYCLECSSDIKLGKLDISFHVFLSIFSVRCSDFPSVKSFWAFHRDFWRAALSLNYMTPQSACQHNLSFLWNSHPCRVNVNWHLIKAHSRIYDTLECNLYSWWHMISQGRVSFVVTHSCRNEKKNWIFLLFYLFTRNIQVTLDIVTICSLIHSWREFCFR